MYLSNSKVTHIYHNRIAIPMIEGPGYWEGTGNMCADPDMDESCHLNWDSECANAGIQGILINDVWIYSPTHDIDGEVRPYLTTMPDLGADESPVIRVAVPEPAADSQLDFKINPNPIIDHMIISYKLERADKIMCSIYTLNGEEIGVLINKWQEEGNQTLTWKCDHLPAGIYFCVVKAGTTSTTQKFIKLD